MRASTAVSRGLSVPLRTQNHFSVPCTPDLSGTAVPSGSPGSPRTSRTGGTKNPVRGFCTSCAGGTPEVPGAPLGAVVPELPLGEIYALRAEFWALLPLPSTLHGALASSPAPIYVTSSRAVWEALKRSKRVVFGTLEWASLVSAYEVERSSVHSFAEWVSFKRRNPAWRLLQHVAIGCALQPGPPQGASVGEVLRGWGVVLTGVSYGSEVPS